MDVFEDTYLGDVLHIISQGLLIPTIIAIILLLCATVFFIGQVLVEYFAVRRGRANPDLLEGLVNKIEDAKPDELDSLVRKSDLLALQKRPLEVVIRNGSLPEEALFSLAEMEVDKVRSFYQKRLSWTDMSSKIAPLLGLMGTLIPLGPGIVALGQDNVVKLSQSLLIAFDATVCGLVCAIVALIISKIRSRWYGNDLKTLEALMNCVLEKLGDERNG